MAANIIIEAAEDLSLDMDMVKERIDAINKEVQISSFGVKWRKQGGPLKKKSKPKDPKQVKKVFSDQCRKLDDMVKLGSSFKDVNQKMFKMRTLLTIKFWFSFV